MFSSLVIRVQNHNQEARIAIYEPKEVVLMVVVAAVVVVVLAIAAVITAAEVILSTMCQAPSTHIISTHQSNCTNSIGRFFLTSKFTTKTKV